MESNSFEYLLNLSGGFSGQKNFNLLQSRTKAPHSNETNLQILNAVQYKIDIRTEIFQNLFTANVKELLKMAANCSQHGLI